MSRENEAMTAVRVEVDAFKRLRVAQLVPSEKGLVLVRGKNGAGKSSLLDGMFAALAGREGKVELPITEGEHGGHVEIDLGDLIVRRQWKRDSGGDATTTLTVTDAEGHPRRSPQRLLDELTGRFADPVAFIDMPAAEQVKTVLGAVGLQEKLGDLEERERECFDARREDGKRADSLAKSVAELEARVADAPPAPETSLEAATAALQRAVEVNHALDEDRRIVERVGREGAELSRRIEALEAELASLREKKESLTVQWREAATRVRDEKPVDLDPLRQAVRECEAAAEFRGRRELLERAREDHRAAAAAHSQRETDLAAVRNEIAALLESTPFPVEGMSYDHESRQLTVGGIPFSQASQAEKVKVAAAVAMAGSPKIRVLFVREGSLFDEDSRALLAEIAEREGFQVWFEVVDSSPEGSGVWIENGEAHQCEADG